MDNWKLATPVALKFFVRKETLEKTFAVIKQIKPRILFLIGDGPRNVEEQRQILECRNVVENIDWECEVYRFYFEENKGIFASSRAALLDIFEIVDRVIFVEDDMLCSRSFFWFCQEMLEKYKDDLRIQMVCGQNLEEISSEINDDYFFAQVLSSGAIGMWKNRWELTDYTYPVFESTYMTSVLKENMPKNRRGYIVRAFNDRKEYLKDSAPKSTEVAYILNMYLNNMVSIVPKKNMAVSIGLSENSAHTPDRLEKLPKGIRKVFELEIYDMEFPLKHPKYVMRDLVYEKKWYRIHAEGYPLISIWRLFVRFILSVKYDGFMTTIKIAKVKMKKRLSQRSDLNG